MLTLIDGNSILFRAYYGVHSRLTRTDGTPTGAVYGFINMILPVLSSAQPNDSFVCVFDASRITFRQDIYPEYKMNRSETPADLIAQGEIIRRALPQMGIPTLCVPGVEADDVIATSEDFRRYANLGVGVEYTKYFNSGVLLMNLDEYRKEQIQQRFIYLLIKYNFDTAAPDQDYLNVLCYNKVHYIDKSWDKMPVGDEYEGELNLIHYNNFRKPWFYDDVPYGEYFWEYAKKTDYYEDILEIKKNFT